MSIQEHEDNRFIKENDEIEKYLLRIIHRYFDIENTFTNESIEAIIAESLTRFKQMAIKEKGFIFSLNNKTGNIALTIQDFGGQRAFTKRTAFNKDFGDQPETICEGNDERLSDEREPLEHFHAVLNIDELKETLENICISESASHAHKNKNVLDMIKYTGTQAQIDLIILEQLETSIKYHCDTLEFKKNEVRNIYDKQINVSAPYIGIIDAEMTSIKNIIESSITWLNDIKNYVNKKLEAIENATLNTFAKHISNEKIQSLINSISSAYFVSQEGELIIPNGAITCNPSTDNTWADGTPWGTCFVEEDANASITVPGLNNPKVKFYFRYEDNDETITMPLPFCMKRNNEIVLIEGSYTKTGKVSIRSRYIVNLPDYGTNDNIYSSDTIIIESRNGTYYYDDIVAQLSQKGCNLCLIDSSDKNIFVKNLLHENETYFIQGTNFNPEGPQFVDNDGNEMNYFDWDVNQPDYSDMINCIYINENKKWATVKNMYTEAHGYILEYKIKRLSDIYKNPRVYYQILENREVV